MTVHPILFKRAGLWLALLCAACAILATAVTWGVYGAIPHLEDEHAQLYQAKVFAAGRMTAPVVQPPLAFNVPFTIVMGDRVFSKYPPGYALLLAAGVLVGQPWGVNVVMAVLGITGVYCLGRELFGESEGLLAAGLGIISPMFVMLSGTYLPHTSDLALLTWFAWGFVRARRAQGDAALRYAAAAGGLAGLALAIRPLTAGAVGLPFLALAAADVLRGARGRLKVYLWMAGGFALGAVIWPVYNWAATGSALTNTYQLYWPYDVVGFGPQIGRFGHSLEEGLANIWADLAGFDETALGWPAWWGISAMWVVMGLGLALPRRSRWEAFLLLPAAALVLAHAAYWTRSDGLYGPRYFAEAMPFVWLLAARGLVKLDGSKGMRLAGWAARLLLPVWMVWSAAFLIFPHFEQARNLYDISRADAEAVQAAGLDNALVFVVSDYWTDYARLSWLNAPVVWKGNLVFVREMSWSSNLLAHAQFPNRPVYRFNRYANPPLSACPDPCTLFPPPIIDYNGMHDVRP